MPACIRYKSGYKYQLDETYDVATGIIPSMSIHKGYLRLYSSGLLTIHKGYAWDGPSGPAVDTLNFMRGSLVHDAFYQLMREGHLDATVYREDVDRLLQRMCKEDGMTALRAWWVYTGVRFGGGNALGPRKRTHAPKGCNA